MCTVKLSRDDRKFLVGLQGYRAFCVKKQIVGTWNSYKKHELEIFLHDSGDYPKESDSDDSDDCGEVDRSLLCTCKREKHVRTYLLLFEGNNRIHMVARNGTVKDTFVFDSESNRMKSCKHRLVLFSTRATTPRAMGASAMRNHASPFERKAGSFGLITAPSESASAISNLVFQPFRRKNIEITEEQQEHLDQARSTSTAKFCAKLRGLWQLHKRCEINTGGISELDIHSISERLVCIIANHDGVEENCIVFPKKEGFENEFIVVDKNSTAKPFVLQLTCSSSGDKLFLWSAQRKSCLTLQRLGSNSQRICASDATNRKRFLALERGESAKKTRHRH